MKSNTRPSRTRGFTLVEVILFIVVVSVGLAGLLTVYQTSVRSSADPMIRKQAILIAEATMNEIMQKSFQNDPADPANTSATLGCTPNTAPACAANSWANRPNYNDVDDYNGFNQTGILQIDGSTAVNGLANYTLQINVAGAALGGIAAANAKRIVVTVTNGGTEIVTLTGFRTNY
jgi:MSHA pilin protein MshD